MNSVGKNTTRSIRLANEWANGVADKLGRRIDRRIKPAVAALYAAGFRPTGSCEAHLTRGEPAPWIDIGVGPISSDATRSALRRARNLQGQRRLIRLLDAFYAGRPTGAGVRLIVTPFGIEGGLRLVNQAADVQRVEPKTRQIKNLNAFRKEFDAFAAFLRQNAIRH